MPFKKVKRYKYSIDPIDNVICQLRFPNNLSIDQIEYLSKFQTKIMDVFTEYEAKIENNTIVNMDNVQKVTTTNHEFSVPDYTMKVNLSKNFVALSTSNYLSWEDYKEKFLYVLHALTTTYTIPYFTRVGLRYVDVFVRSKFGVKDEPWKNLINPEFIGPLAGEYYHSVQEFNLTNTFKCEDNKNLIRVNIDLVKKIGDDEVCLRMDNDIFSNDNIKKEDLVESLEYKHDRVSRILRHAILDELHTRMEPVEIE